MKKRNYYAVVWRTGGNTFHANTRKRYCVDYYAFATKKERDTFCDGGSDFPLFPNWREPMSSNDCELRAALKSGEVTFNH